MLRLLIATIVLLFGTCNAQEQTLSDANVTIYGVTAPRDGYPDISPDGRKIVFQSNRTGSWQLWRVNADGSAPERLTHGGANDLTPVWSKDGRHILFASDRSDPQPHSGDREVSVGSRDIYVLDVAAQAAGSHAAVRRVVESDADEMHPEWAGDKRQIIFNQVNATNDGSTIVITGAEENSETIVANRPGWNTYASLTPDGSRIVWRGSYDENHDGQTRSNSDIYSSKLDGTNERRLTVDPAFDGWPAVSPDGTTIAFASNRGDSGYFHIYTMTVAGDNLQQLTDGSFNYTQPAWSRDGKRIAAFRWLEDDAGEIGHIVLLDLPD